MNNGVLIVGGGVIGLSIARELHRSGIGTITVIDAAACAGEASWAAGGMLAPLAEADEMGPFFDLCMLSRDHYPSLSEDLLDETGIDIELDRAGTLYLAFTADDSEMVRARYDRHKAAGLEVTLLDSMTVRAAEPRVSPDVREALYFPGDWQVDNRKLCAALRRYCEINNVRIIENTPIKEVVLDGGRAVGVKTRSETLSADEVVLAAGAWTSHIFCGTRPLPVDVEPVLGQMISLRGETRAFQRAFQRVIYSSDGYIVPRRDGRVLAGSTTEKTGFERRTTELAAASIFAMAGRIAPDITNMMIEDHWCGLRPRAADGFPVIGRIEGIGGLFIATGHYRNGILLAPVTGALAAESITGGEPSAYLSIFGPDRFRSLANGVGS